MDAVRTIELRAKNPLREARGVFRLRAIAGPLDLDVEVVACDCGQSEIRISGDPFAIERFATEFLSSWIAQDFEPVPKVFAYEGSKCQT